MNAGGRRAAKQDAAAAAATAAPGWHHGVPDGLRSWWERVDPKDLEKSTMRSGRIDVLTQVCRRLRAGERVVDLGCGCGLLAKEAGRRDIVGVDISPRMLEAASAWMDLVLPESFLEFYPSQRFDTAVLCNVIEPYSEDMRLLLFRHIMDFLNPGGQVIVVVATRSSSPGSTSESGLDLVFPTISDTVRPADIEDALVLSGFDIQTTELLEARTLNHTAVLPGEAPKAERRTYALLIGRRPRAMIVPAGEGIAAICVSPKASPAA